MYKQKLIVAFGIVLISAILFNACSKVNESTFLGGDIIPEVDNINTFEEFYDIEVYNDTFNVNTDSTLYTYSGTQFLGNISNDPFFGKSDAKLYFQLAPASFPFTYSNVKDSLHLDSVVLVLDYVGTYGDSSIPQTITVREVSQAADFVADSAYQIRKSTFPTAGILGSKTIIPHALKDSVKVYKDTTAKQLRIKLDNSFGQRLLNYDTTNSGISGALRSDSLFKTFFKGFAVESTGGNALMGFTLTGANTKLAIYYKDDNNSSDPAKFDTAVAYFNFKTPNSYLNVDSTKILRFGSAAANYIQRDYTGTLLAAAAGQTTPADFAYIQATPGSFARLKVLNFSNTPNRIIHRAELMMEQVYDYRDTMFKVPEALYVDIPYAAQNGYRSIPVDFGLDAYGSPNLSAYGAYPLVKKDAAGNNIALWRINMTRYIQRVVTGLDPFYDELRLYAPYYTYNYYAASVSATPANTAFPIGSTVGVGRVRLGGYQHPTQKMRLRVVYSKL